MKALLAEHTITPEQEIRSRIGKLLDKVQCMGARALVAVYQRPQKTKGGIYLTDKYKDEDIYQGKVGLILKMGPLAFTEDESHDWGNVVPKVGDWISFRVGDTWQMLLGEQHCRMVEDVDVRLILTEPDVVY